MSTLSDSILEASRPLLLEHTGNWPGCGIKNPPLLALLEALIDSATTTANAVADNCWDDCIPIPADRAKAMAEACYRLGSTITAAAAAPDCKGWSLPSMSGKELV